jgi:hypothetical protein
MDLMIMRSAIEFRGPMETYVVKEESGRSLTRWFCPVCGTGVYLAGDATPESIFLKAGTLDDASWVVPQMHIYTAARQPWVQINDGLPQYEKLPDQ